MFHRGQDQPIKSDIHINIKEIWLRTVAVATECEGNGCYQMVDKVKSHKLNWKAIYFKNDCAGTKTKAEDHKFIVKKKSNIRKQKTILAHFSSLYYKKEKKATNLDNLYKYNSFQK